METRGHEHTQIHTGLVTYCYINGHTHTLTHKYIQTKKRHILLVCIHLKFKLCEIKWVRNALKFTNRHTLTLHMTILTSMQLTNDPPIQS